MKGWSVADQSPFGSQVAVGVVTALVLTALGLAFAWFNKGGLIDLLGGETKAQTIQDVTEQIRALKPTVKTFPEGKPYYSAADNNVTISDETSFDLCAVNYISVNVGGGGQCGVSRVNGAWTVLVTTDHHCRVVCLKVLEQH